MCIYTCTHILLSHSTNANCRGIALSATWWKFLEEKSPIIKRQWQSIFSSKLSHILSQKSALSSWWSRSHPQGEDTLQDPFTQQFLFRNFVLCGGLGKSGRYLPSGPNHWVDDAARQHYDRWCSSFPSRGDGRNGGTSKNRRCRNKKQGPLWGVVSNVRFSAFMIVRFFCVLKALKESSYWSLHTVQFLYSLYFVKMLLAT